eukprot:GDKI01032609.1.p1 GENE.GDKI01032609.1~~GDKI01032609.1.p1  ORF type:complete len:105 (+),score=26.72 GDKI01032609.1:219-533(+)
MSSKDPGGTATSGFFEDPNDSTAGGVDPQFTEVLQSLVATDTLQKVLKFIVRKFQPLQEQIDTLNSRIQELEAELETKAVKTDIDDIKKVCVCVWYERKRKLDG